MAVVAVLGYVVRAGLLVTVANEKFGGDVRGFLFLGRDLLNPPAFAGMPRCGAYGYDGQFYAALATDSMLRSEDTKKALDAPAHRASRILVPMLPWPSPSPAC